MTALGLDFGTTSVSAVAVDVEGHLVARVTNTHKADVTGLPPGHAEQDPKRLLDVALDSLRELSLQLTLPATCLGITGQMHGVLLTDKKRQPVSNLITWQDKRSLEAEGGRTWLARFRARCDDSAVERTGCNPSPGYLAVTLFSLGQQKQIPAGARHALIFADWAAATLSGTMPVTDRTNAASTGVYDLEKDYWSGLIEPVGLAQSFFPDVVESGQVVGGLTPEFAERTGLPVGLSISSAIGDHQAAVLGSLPAGEEAVQVNIGTGGQVSIPIATFLRTSTSDTRYLPDNRFLLVGAGMAGGDAYAWVQRTASTWIEAFGSERSEREIFDVLNALASEVPPGCEGLVCEPFFRGTRREPARRGVFSGVSSENFSPGHVARAVLEGIAGALAQFTSEHATRPEVSGTLSRLIATGNAVRRNRLLAVSLTRAFGLPLFVPEHEEEAAYGAAVLAGVRNGLWVSLADAGRHFRLKRIAAPDDRN